MAQHTCNCFARSPISSKASQSPERSISKIQVGLSISCELDIEYLWFVDTIQGRGLILGSTKFQTVGLNLFLFEVRRQKSKLQKVLINIWRIFFFSLGSTAELLLLYLVYSICPLHCFLVLWYQTHNKKNSPAPPPTPTPTPTPIQRCWRAPYR